MRLISFLYLFICLFILSCVNNEDNYILASVYNKELMLSDVIGQIPQENEDSITFVQYYIDNWIKQELLLHHAELNLSIDMKDYDKQVNEYRRSLLIYAYQQQLINQNFDTSIHIDEIINYYEQFKEEFKLSNNIFKGRYVVVDKSAPKLDRLAVWYNSNKEESILNLQDYCQQFAKEYYLEDTVWQYLSLIKDNVSNEKIADEEYFLKNNHAEYFTSGEYIYYFYIRDYKIKGNISPLSMEKEKIRNVLLNKKKIEYLRKLEDELYQNGLALKKINIY